jgi:hypothetical protein
VSRRIWLGVTVLVLLGASAAIVLNRDVEPLAPAAAAVAPSSAPPTPQTPDELTSAALKAQAAALIAGDEAGWLAAVDPGQPKLRARYASMYRSLRGLGVSHFTYHSYAPGGIKKGTVAVRAHVAYCFSRDTCPDYSDYQWEGPPRIAQALTFKQVGGRWVISALGKAAKPNELQPTPWEKGDLVFAHGKRVTVAAAKSQRRHLKRVLALAEKSAAITDRYAAYVKNPQSRYRIYLADDRAWKSWYGGEKDKWVVGLAVPLNEAGTDTVLRMSEMDDRQLLSTTIQHEMGHVVTLSGATTRDHAEDRWLSEGIAEYIGWAPKSAAQSWRKSSVRIIFRGNKRLTTMVSKPLGSKASDRAVDAFYGLGHFAADCLAEKYGEKKLFTFVGLALRQDNTYDQASRDAFGKPFATVDKACVSWIKKQL